MFILDTNVVSELRRPDRAHPAVLAWAQRADVGLFHLSVVTLLELELGVLRIERRDARQGAILREWLDDQMLPQFQARILAIEPEVAVRCARLHVPDPRSERDALIAATALIHGMAVVTRNVADFAGMGVELVDPWTAPHG